MVDDKIHQIDRHHEHPQLHRMVFDIGGSFDGICSIVFLGQSVAADEEEQGDANPPGKREDIPNAVGSEYMGKESVCGLSGIDHFIAGDAQQDVHKIVDHNQQDA